MEDVTMRRVTGRVCGIDIGKAGMAPPSGCRRTRNRRGGRRRPRLRRHETGGGGAGGVVAVLAGARGGDGGILLEAGVLPAGGRGIRVRAGRRQAGQAPARPPQAGPVRLAVAGGVLRARRHHLLLRGRPGVPDHPRAHPVPARPDRRTDPREAARGEAAGIRRDQAVQRGHRPAPRDRPGHHGPPDRTRARPQVLAQLARARARRKISELEAALEGAEFFTPQLAALLARMLARIDQLNASIRELTAVVETLLEPYEDGLQQAESMPGWGRRSAQDAVAETGVDMTRSAPAATWPPERAAPRWTTSPEAAADARNPRRATRTWPPSPARPPSPHARPRPAKAPATGGSPAAAANPKQASRSATPS